MILVGYSVPSHLHPANGNCIPESFELLHEHKVLIAIHSGKDIHNMQNKNRTKRTCVLLVRNVNKLEPPI
jgi:hypothetical protein